jgi:hypothetical protein
MLRPSSTGLKSRHLVAKSVRSCLGRAFLPYNWHDELEGLILAVLVTRSVVLKVLARAGSGRVKTRLNRLSQLLSLERFDVERAHKRFVASALGRLSGRDLLLYLGKVVLVVDITEYAKPRSRGKKRPMPHAGQVRLNNIPGDDNRLAAGYQEVWAGLLLRSGDCLGVWRRLFTEKAPFFTSQNMLTDVALRQARDLAKAAFGREAILVMDRGFARKELLAHLTTEEPGDFVVRLQGNWKVETLGGRSGALEDVSRSFVERLRMQWRPHSRVPLYCAVRAFPVRLRHEGKVFEVNMLRVDSIRDGRPPIFLATSLPIDTLAEAAMVVRLYSTRWAIETFFFQLKQSLGAGGFRVFGSWRTMDRLLAVAHMAMLALQLLYLTTRKRHRAFWDSAIEVLARWSIRPANMRLTQFLEALAMDFLQQRYRWSLL